MRLVGTQSSRCRLITRSGQMDAPRMKSMQVHQHLLENCRVARWPEIVEAAGSSDAAEACVRVWLRHGRAIRLRRGLYLVRPHEDAGSGVSELDLARGLRRVEPSAVVACLWALS